MDERVQAALMAVGLLLQPLAAAGPTRAIQAACPDAERQFLASLAGGWAGATTERVGPDEYAEGHGLVESTPVLGGCGLIMVLETSAGTHVTSGVQVLAADRDGQLQLSAVDSEHGAFTVSAGSLRGDTLVLEWRRDTGDRVLRTRKEHHVTSSGEYHVVHRLATDRSGRWAITFQGRYRRP